MRQVRAGWGWGLAALLWVACGGTLEEAAPPLVAPEPGTQEQAAHASALRTRWVRTHEGVRFEAVASDGGGNLYVALQYFGGQTLAGVALPGSGSPDDYHLGVAKFRPDNSLAWVRGWGSAHLSGSGDFNFLKAFTVTRGGSVYVGGEAGSDGVRAGGQALTQGTFLLRLDAAGRVQWARSVQPQPNSHLGWRSFAPHPDGGLYALATYESLSDPSSSGLTLLRYGTDGRRRWGNVYSQRAGASTFPTYVAADESGNAYVSGAASGPATFGGPVNSGELVPFVFSTSGAGAHRWTRFLPVEAGGFAEGLAARAGRVVVVVYAAGENEALLGLTTGRGAQRWRRDLGNVDHPLTLATSARNEVVLGVGSGDAGALGVPRQSPSPDGFPQATSFVARLRRSDGLFVSARNFEVRWESKRNYVHADSVAVTDGGIVAVAGQFYGTVDFGSGPRSGSEASFVLRASP